MAAVVPRRGAAPTLDALCTFLRGHRIAVEKLPEDLVLTDELPTSAGGKIDKAALRDGVLAGRVGTAAGERNDAEIRR